jgi:hypothetical protein
VTSRKHFNHIVKQEQYKVFPPFIVNKKTSKDRLSITEDNGEFISIINQPLAI